MTLDRLAGRVALVTGVSRRAGIAATITSRLLDAGAQVMATGWEPHDDEMPWGADPEGGAAFVASLDRADAIEWRPADLGDPDVPASLVAATAEQFGSIDMVLAVHARSSHVDLASVTADELDRCWAVNARASVLLAQAFATAFDPGRGHGRVVLFTSGQHLGPMGGEIAYAVSKGAIHQMTASIADQVADLGITVNCINPGPVDTGWPADLPEHVREHLTERFPAKRWGTPDDVANLVMFLVGAEGGWVTGQVINSEGGFRR